MSKGGTSTGGSNKSPHSVSSASAHHSGGGSKGRRRNFILAAVASSLIISFIVLVSQMVTGGVDTLAATAEETRQYLSKLAESGHQKPDVDPQSAGSDVKEGGKEEAGSAIATGGQGEELGSSTHADSVIDYGISPFNLSDQCNAAWQKDLDDPAVRAIRVPSSNAEYLKIRKGGNNYPDFMFQCRENRFGDHLHAVAEMTRDPDSTILEPSSRLEWCSSTEDRNSEKSKDRQKEEEEISSQLHPLNTPAIPSLVEGVPTPSVLPPSTDPRVLAAGKDRTFETLIPLLKMSLRRTEYFKALFEFHQKSIDAPTPDTQKMWDASQKYLDETNLGSSLLLQLWNERFSLTTEKVTDSSTLDHEEKLKRIIVVTTWLLNRPAELQKHILKMVALRNPASPTAAIKSMPLTEYWSLVQNFQLAALGITGRFRDETFFNNEVATKHCQIDSHDNEQASPNGRKFRAFRLENIQNIRHNPNADWDFCDMLTVDVFLRLCGLSIASTQDMESLFVFNARGAMGTRNEPSLETPPSAGLPNSKVASTLVKVMPGALPEDFDPHSVYAEDTCVVDGTTMTLGSVGIDSVEGGEGSEKGGTQIKMAPTLCRFRHLARAFRKYHRLTLRMGAVAATDRAAAHGLSKLFEEEGVALPSLKPHASGSAPTCDREDSRTFEWLDSLKRMDRTLKNVVPELLVNGVYDADEAQLKDTNPAIPKNHAPLMRNPMVELWTQKIDDGFIPIWPLTLWEQQQFELMTGPYAAHGLLHIDRRYRADSLSFNAHPFTVAMRRGTIVNSKLHERFGGGGADTGVDASTTVVTGQVLAPHAARQFLLAPSPSPHLDGALFQRQLGRFGLDQKVRTSLAKLQHVHYGFVDLDELVEATEKAHEGGASAEAASRYLSKSNALSTMARLLSYYVSIPYKMNQEEADRHHGNEHCKPFSPSSGAVGEESNTKAHEFSTIVQCPAHPIHTEGIVGGTQQRLIFFLHRHPLGTYAIVPDVKVSLGTAKVSGKGKVSIGHVIGVKRTPPPPGIKVNDDVGARIPHDVIASLQFSQIAAEGAKEPQSLDEFVKVYTIGHAEHIGSELTGVLEALKATSSTSPAASKKVYLSALSELRKASWRFALNWHRLLKKQLHHGESVGLLERWPSYFAMVPLRWDSVFVPANAILQLSSAPIYTAAAVIRRPMVWVGSEANVLLVRCVASNAPNCAHGNYAEDVLGARDRLLATGVNFSTVSSVDDDGALSTLRHVPSFELTDSLPSFVSLIDAFHQRFPMTMVNDVFWMSLIDGLDHMKSSLTRHNIPTDTDLQPPFSSCRGLRDAHPYVQYALSNSYGEATVSAVSEDHYGGLVFSQAKATRPFQQHLSPAFFGLNGDEDSFETTQVARRHGIFSKIREAMWRGLGAW